MKTRTEICDLLVRIAELRRTTDIINTSTQGWEHHVRGFIQVSLWEEIHMLEGVLKAHAP